MIGRWLAPAALAVALPALLAAQHLEAGTWSGTIEFPDGDSTAISATVRRDTPRISIELRAATGMTCGLGDITEREGRVEFSWALDRPQPLRCRLSARTPTRWEGRCDDLVRGPDGKFLRLLVTLWRPTARTDPPR